MSNIQKSNDLQKNFSGQSLVLKWGIVLVLFLLLFYALEFLLTWKKSTEQETEVVYSKLSQLQTTLAHDKESVNWLAETEKLKQAKVNLEQRLWQANSSSLAEVLIIDWLQNDYLGKYNVNDLRIEVAASALDETKIPHWRVEVNIYAKATPEKILAFTKDIENEAYMIQIKQLKINPDHFETKLLIPVLQVS